MPDDLATSEPAWSDPLPEEEEGPVLPRRPVSDTAEMDITPMIDIVFLLLIFFLVCSTTSAQSAVDLPPARHGTGVGERTSTVITIVNREGPGPPRVYLADGPKGDPLPEDENLQRTKIIDAVQKGYDEDGKSTVLVKAEKGVKLGDTWRVYSAVGQVEGIQLHVGVEEVD